MATQMKAMQFKTVGGPLELAHIPIPKPGPNQVRIKVHVCGICHSDVTVQYQGLPGGSLPRVPGHEVAGVIDALGDGVTSFSIGEKVGVGWIASFCGDCRICRQGDRACCPKGTVCGFHFDGGYAEYMVAPLSGVARIPAELDFAVAAPLLCAGITTYNVLKCNPAKPGDLVAVQGLGGLGHLGVQFAVKMGYNVVALSNGKSKEELAKKLGAHHYIDTTDPEEAVKALLKLGGAKILLSTAPSAKAIEPLLPGLDVGGKVLLVSYFGEPLAINVGLFLLRRLSVQSWASGDCYDAESCMQFSSLTGIKPMVEEFPLEKANEAFQSMLANKAKFRAVLRIH